MAHLIDKDALVTEIKKRAIEAGLHDGVIAETREDECYSILSFIDTLEVKEIDINKEISQFIDANFEKAKTGHKLSLRRTAKHFFELGLKAQKGERI